MARSITIASYERSSRRAAEQWLPHEVIYQPKIGFGAPVATWLRGRLGHHVEAQLSESGLVRSGILRGTVVRDLIAAHRANRADNAQAIWALYCVARWYDLMIAPGQLRQECVAAPSFPIRLGASAPGIA